MKYSRFALLIITTLSIAFFPSQIVNSQRSGFSISPENPEIAYFDFTINPGETIEDAFNAKNFGSDKIYMMVEVVEATTAQNGGLAYDFSNNGGASKWVTINAEKKFELRGSNMKRLPFTVTVPPGTPPGEYTIGFLAALVPTTPTPIPSDQPGSFVVDVVTRIALTLIIHVPGEEICDLTITKMEPEVMDAKWRFETRVQNIGNIHFKGSSTLIITDISSNQRITEKTQNIGYFSTHSELLTYNTLDVPKPGTYSYQYDLVDSSHPNCKFSTTGQVTYGKKEQNQMATQSTMMAVFARPTETPQALSTATISLAQQIQKRGTLPWYVWITAVVFLISCGFIIYALSILKSNKK